MAASVVLVHGHMHGSWCWNEVVDGLAKLDIRSIAVDLRGRGINKDRPTSLVESLKVIDEAISALDGPIVRCGHSSAGVPISWPATQIQSIPDIVYGRHAAARGRGHGGLHRRSYEEGRPKNARFEAGYSTVASFQDAVDMMYDDCTIEVAQWAYDRLIPEPFSRMPEPDRTSPIKPWEHARMTYGVCTRDSSPDPQAQRRIAAHAHEVVELPTGHSPWLSQPQLCVDFLARLAAVAR